MNKRFTVFFLFLFGFLNAQDFVNNQLLIQTEDQLLEERMIFSGIDKIECLSKNNHIYLLHLDERESLENQIQILKRNKDIRHVQKNRMVELRQEPNDEFWSSQWNMLKISADKVWDFTTGGQTTNGDEIVIAIIDDGYDLEHEDLLENIWTNKGEIPNNGIDDDLNGYIDDFYGWNFASNSNVHPNLEHGTSIIGVIGATGNNNMGVSGVNFNVKMMLLSGAIMESTIVTAYDYIIEMRKKYNESNGEEGALIVSSNFSAGIGRLFGTDFPLWCSMYDKLGEVGILTASAVDNNVYDVDIEGDMPTTCGSDFIISVSNSTQNDGIDAAYGATFVDIAAPGESIFTTDTGNDYHSISGSSLSTPHVTGAIGLLYASACPELLEQMKTEPQIVAETMKDAIMNGAVKIMSFENRSVSEGRLDLFESVKYLQANCGGSIGQLSVSSKVSLTDDGFTVLRYETPDFEKYELLVYDASGKFMYNVSVTPPAFDVKEIRIPSSNWVSGMYFFTLANNEYSASGSFFKP